MPITDFSLNTPLFHREAGSGGVPVLLLHGLFGAGDNLGALARQLAATRRAVQVDLRNHGQSPHHVYIDLPAMAADVLALMDTLAIAQADIVGHSLGGKVAMQIALNQPQRVQRLVIADIAPVAYGRGHDTVFAALHAVDLAAVQSRADAERMMAPFIDEPALRQFLLKSLQRTDEGGYRWRFDLAALEANYDALRAAPVGEPFAGPTLFIRGGRSDYISTAHEPLLRKLFPHHRLETIAEAGHWVHGEQPAPFNAMVQQFLDSID